jgi:hypothetical protein
MIRVQRGAGISSLRGLRAASAGRRGSRFNGSGSDPTKNMVVSGGGTEEVPRRRGPGSTKMIRVTNKAGRVFDVAIPISKLTHPQKKLISPVHSGEWRQIDTSFVDVGDVDDDVHTSIDEALRQGQMDRAALAEELRSFCVAYVSMDTDGMVNHPQKDEQNTGPDYEDEDRKSIRRRKWFTLLHRFEDVRTIVWPDTLSPLRNVQFPVFPYDSARYSQQREFGSEDRQECSICLCSYEDAQEILVLPCLHWFHAKCVQQWMEKHTDCPLCQLDILSSLGRE